MKQLESKNQKDTSTLEREVVQRAKASHRKPFMWKALPVILLIGLLEVVLFIWVKAPNIDVIDLLTFMLGNLAAIIAIWNFLQKNGQRREKRGKIK